MATPEQTLVLAIDQGTSSSRALVFDASSGNCLARAQHAIDKVEIGRDGWIEQDAGVLFSSVEKCLLEVQAQIVETVPLSAIKAVGITNQRETTVVWDKTTGVALYNAIVWQDQRTEDIVKGFQPKWNKELSDLCGLPLDTYFSATKLRWLLDNCEAVKTCVAAGNCMFGTVDTWLVWKLTGGIDGGCHVTDVTNASRTMLMDIKTCQWSPTLKQFFQVPDCLHLPKICSSSEVYGKVHSSVAGGHFEGMPIAGCLGDQQAALVGHGCLSAGSAKSTYGTGCFMLFNTGLEPVKSRHGLLTTVAYKFGDEPAHYALEGAVAVAGDIVKWLRDMQIISSAAETEELAEQVENDDEFDVMFVPAFSGLKAPYWKADARGMILGLTYNTSRRHICRAALESTCFQTKEVFDSMMEDATSQCRLQALRVDGGMTANQYFMQKLANILHIDIACPSMAEVTALGAAYAAGRAVGVDVMLDADVTVLKAQDSAAGRALHYRRWKAAVLRCQNWHGTSFESA